MNKVASTAASDGQPRGYDVKSHDGQDTRVSRYAGKFWGEYCGTWPRGRVAVDGGTDPESRAGRVWMIAVLATFMVIPPMSQPAVAGGKIEIDEDSWISVGAGARMGYTRTYGAADGTSNTFAIHSVRLYVDGQARENIAYTFNAVCRSCVFQREDDFEDLGATGEIDVLDAIARFEFSPQFNVWLGRMLTPADRIEMNGPYYGLNWNQYTVPLLPSDQLGRAGLVGRDDGVTVWGSHGKFQYAVGIFDGVDSGGETGPNQNDNVLWAGRFSYNFLTMESGPFYYTSSTYYGEIGDVLTAAVSLQHQEDGTGIATDSADFTAVIFDGLFEKVLPGGAVLTLEGEYKMFDANLASLQANTCLAPNSFCPFDGDAYFTTAAYLFAEPVGIGRVQPYTRYTSNEPDSGPDSNLTEFGVNYVIEGHNLRLNANFTTGTASLTGVRGDSTEKLFFGVQIQI